LTRNQLRAFLSHPHGAMPDLSLSRSEIDDLIAYLETFRRGAAQHPSPATGPAH
jgi:hypothetical protein